MNISKSYLNLSPLFRDTDLLFCLRACFLRALYACHYARFVSCLTVRNYTFVFAKQEEKISREREREKKEILIIQKTDRKYCIVFYCNYEQ